MTRRLLCIAAAGLLLLGPALVPWLADGPGTVQAAEGKLGKFEAKLKSGGGSGRSVRVSGGDKALLAYLFVEFFVHVAPYLLFPQYRFHYQDFPYATDEGYAQYYGDTPWSPPGSPPPLYTRPIAFELRAGYLVDSPDLHGYRIYGKARFSWAFNMDVDVMQLREWTSSTTFDALTFTKVDGLFNLTTSPWHDIDLGFGFSYLDGVDLFGGVNVKITGDIFPRRPLGIHFSGAANAFSGGTLMETEFALGLFLQRFELRVGWRALWVDDLEIHGPMAEAAVFF